MQLPPTLNAELIKLGFEPKKIIQVSTWKDTMVLSVEKEGVIFLLKYIGSNAPKNIKASFNRERQFYSQGVEGAPTLIQKDSSFFITEFIQGPTLREEIEKRDLNSAEVSNLVRRLLDLYESSSQRDNTLGLSYQNAYLNLSSLVQSGPIQEKPESWSHRAFNKLLAQLLKFKLWLLLKRSDFQCLYPGFAHGDLHYNNIFISGEQEFYIIDFENVDLKSCYDFDLIYLWTMLEIKTRSGKSKDILNQHFEALFIDLPHRLELRKLFSFSISMNPRFGGREMTLWQKAGRSFNFFFKK